jgi:hypothetical protein
MMKEGASLSLSFFSEGLTLESRLTSNLRSYSSCLPKEMQFFKTEQHEYESLELFPWDALGWMEQKISCDVQ